ncbi:MAG: UDP-N-acetylmuramoyl-L-alanyl-D-glutamate--2,6-diaminopimelate ligase, partial [Ruminiclostridium sp.]|nr:UDP-N-acetylmuramoyl-L-alanyl-D-glutamate--2,6-diaminopimelate ligase [Ruminiclostridium sp.]
TVITDYAHTDDALRKMLAAVKPTVKGRLICLFGGAGERDREKRPMMAQAVSEYADVLVISSDNPASEDPDKIIEEVYAGADKNLPCIKEADRKSAIEKALAIAEKGDVIVLAGKGHERYQIIGKEYLPFCEKDIVKEILSRKE